MTYLDYSRSSGCLMKEAAEMASIWPLGDDLIVRTR
jgi:hypothetical protein